MSNRLTAQVLRDAADLLISGTEGYTDGVNRFMCTAIVRAYYGTDYQPFLLEFNDLLDAHGVGRTGNLGMCDPDEATAQAIRFDFLNLLAESETFE